ncbi:uncharacterized protein LOC111698837 [Eurytemora carolleeae]|uniref:uncharacterized protein LOC111698837 n=1 Tax=Eurytemora carolleeae TaxID=1294199 RepID=UPI000C78009F|nr:uncharacterized protein LOC111698837 [Eurytemora carolleeae]|eukprot:XP_023325055.1 uncharacterized protein LOC111698837 [Eurytemora affinis]
MGRPHAFPFFLWFFSFIFCTQGETLTGFHLLDNKLETRFAPEQGLLTTTTTVAVPKQLSFCIWIYAEFNRFGDQIPVIEFFRLNETGPPFIALMYRKDETTNPKITIDGVSSWNFKNDVVMERKWSHLCVGIDIEENTLMMYQNGVSDFHPISFSAPLKNRLSNNTELPMVVRLGHYYFDSKPLIGKIAGVNVWDIKLSDEELKEYSNCNSVVQLNGNIVNQSTVWNITGRFIERREFSKSEIECSDQNKHKTVFVTSLFKNFEDANEACDKYKLNSMAAEFKSLEEFRKYQDEGTSNPAVLSECWTGGRLLHWLPYSADAKNKSLTQEDFSHVHSKEPLAVMAWRPNQPNGKNLQCVKAYLSLQYDVSWYDFPCFNQNLQWASCTACKIPQTFESSIAITLKGLCEYTKFDTSYQVTNDPKTGYISYIGKKSTVIKYDSQQRLWIMSNVNNPDVRATSSALLKTYVMGTQNWTIKNDIDCEEQESTLLTLSTCKDDEFACSNGLCIDIVKRCDSKTDCRDKSDEFGCRRIQPDESYQKFIAPPLYKHQNVSKIIIEVSADIMDILDIDEKASIFQVQFYLHFSWYDGRLTFFDLRNDSGLNNLSPLEKNLLWIPELVFDNTENKAKTLIDDEATITIEKQGDFYLSGLEEYTNREYYRGSENKITLSRFYNTRFLCQYNLQWYPFDIQNCQLRLTMFGKSGDFATLEAQVLNFFGKRFSKEFVVESYFMRISETRGETELEMNVILGRNLIPIALNTYLPSTLLVIISYVTVFFKPFFFEAVVTVNLTTLLVLVTLFVSVSNSLPPTSYIKMIDVYLIFSLLIPFAEVLLITVMDYLRMKVEKEANTDSLDDTEAGRKVNHHGKMITVCECPSPTQEKVSKRNQQPSVEEVLKKDKKIRPLDLIHRNEEVEVDARQALYSHARKTGRILQWFKRFAVFGIPIIVIMFTVPYFFIGVNHILRARKEVELEE